MKTLKFTFDQREFDSMPPPDGKYPGVAESEGFLFPSEVTMEDGRIVSMRRTDISPARKEFDSR